MGKTISPSVDASIAIFVSVLTSIAQFLERYVFRVSGPSAIENLSRRTHIPVHVSFEDTSAAQVCWRQPAFK